jgi:predicted SAM-dependent methyltransferase
LQIGTGLSTMRGWLNSDLIAGDLYLDLTRPLPLPSDSFSYVFGEHVIEHLSEPAGTALLAELRRILRPGGVVRLTTPDLEKIIAIYEDRNPVIRREDYARFLDDITGKRHERACQILNDYLRLWGHRYVYDEEDLRAKLHDAGFERVERREPGESAQALLRGLESHGGAEWVNEAEAMCLEAFRSKGSP